MPKINTKKQTSFTIKKEQLRNMTIKDMPIRFFSFVGDVIMMILPIYLWDLIMLLVFSGLISFTYYDKISSVIAILIITSVFLTNTALMVIFKGQSFGKRAMGLRVVSKKNKALSTRFLVMRVLLGFAVPLIIAYFISISFGNELIGGMIFIVVNGIVVVIDPLHRSLIDFVFQTKVAIIIDEKTPSEKEETLVTEPNSVMNKTPEQKDGLIDLHVYSSFSHDGCQEVEELFKQAKQLGIKTFSITDHNSIKANSVATRLAPLYGIQYITGVNFDCSYEGKHLRVLGYGMSGNEDSFHRIENENLAKEKASGLRRVELFENHTGIVVDKEKLMRQNRFQVISEYAIAKEVLFNENNHSNSLIKPYLPINDETMVIKEFIRDFFSTGAVANVQMIYPEFKDIVDLIHVSNGKAIIAHPMKTFKYEPKKLELLMEEVDGLEFFTPYHNEEDIKELVQICHDKKLLISAGSEYHGEKHPEFEFGKTGCYSEAVKAVEKTVEKLMN